MAIPTRATPMLLVLAALLLSSGFAAAATTAARHNPNCRRVLDPPGPNCDPDSCKAGCTFRYRGNGICVKSLGCQCDYCPPGVPPTTVRRMATSGL